MRKADLLKAMPMSVKRARTISRKAKEGGKELGRKKIRSAAVLVEMGDKRELFVPLPRHYEFLYALVESTLGGKMAITKAGKIKPGVLAEGSTSSKATMSKVVRELYSNPAFNVWFQEQWGIMMHNMKPQLDIIGMKNAHKNYNYWEAMQRMYGGYVPETKEKKEIDIKGVIMLPERQIFEGREE
jgi:hypothetical protein